MQRAGIKSLAPAPKMLRKVPCRRDTIAAPRWTGCLLPKTGLELPAHGKRISAYPGEHRKDASPRFESIFSVASPVTLTRGRNFCFLVGAPVTGTATPIGQAC